MFEAKAMNENKFIQLRGEISEKRLVEMLNAGLLYYKVDMSEESIDDAVQLVIQQVGRIRKYCMPDYAEAIPGIWKTILTDMLGIRRKLLVKKGKKKGMVNWYQVASVLHYLYIKNVYITSYSESMLDVMLHGKGATYHNSVKSYELTLEQMAAIDRILAKNKKNHSL